METCFQTNFITSTNVQLAALGVTNDRLPTASAQPSTLVINTAARQDNQTFVPLSFQSCFAFSTTARAVAVIFPIRSQNTEVTQSSLYLWDLPATDPLLVPAYSPVNSSPKKKKQAVRGGGRWLWKMSVWSMQVGIATSKLPWLQNYCN